MRRPLLPAAPSERLRIGLRVFTALHEMRIGRARSEEWCDLANALNIVEALCEIDRLDACQVMPLVATAGAGMVEAARRECGQIGMGEAAILALREVVTTYDSAIRRLSAQTMSAAAAHVTLKIASARGAGLSIKD